MTGFVRSLLALARRACDESTSTNIVEPMLADLAYELSDAPSRRRRAIAIARWSVGMCEAALVCGGRALISRTSRLSLERLTVWVYGLLIAAVIGAGPNWVRTGSFSLFATLRGLSRVVPYVPWTFGWGAFPPIGTIRPTARRLAILAALVVIACLLNRGYGWSIVGMTAANFAVMVASRRWFPRGGLRDHLTITS